MQNEQYKLRLKQLVSKKGFRLPLALKPRENEKTGTTIWSDLKRCQVGSIYLVYTCILIITLFT